MTLTYHHINFIPYQYVQTKYKIKNTFKTKHINMGDVIERPWRPELITPRKQVHLTSKDEDKNK